jgi:hypothetical protein
MIYTASRVMFLMRTDPLQGQVGGGLALEIETFLGPVKWHLGTKKSCPRATGDFKGTVSRDFLLQVFFMNHLPPSP